MKYKMLELLLLVTSGLCSETLLISKLNLGNEIAIENKTYSCPDAQIGLECEEDCSTDIVDCRLDCSSTDYNCLLDCGLALLECVNDCPCYPNCPLGCSGCSSPYCVCTDDPENDPDYQICKDKVDEEYYKCIVACSPTDRLCLNKCIRTLNDDLQKCPCMPECPLGCPCPSYECPSSTSTTSISTTTASTTSTTSTAARPTSVLVLNTYRSDNVPLVVDGLGSRGEPRFTIGQNTGALYSCGVTWRNEFYIYGGNRNTTRQISKINGCRLERVGDLGFDFYFGGCATDSEDKIYLCFNQSGGSEHKTCRASNDPTNEFGLIQEAAYDHGLIRVATSADFLFAVGSSHGQSFNKAELFSLSNKSWKTTNDYPFSNQIYYASVLNVGDAFYTFGGVQKQKNVIAKFEIENETWSQVGTLTFGRVGHGAIPSGQSILVVGGDNGNFPTEKCDFDQSGKIQCVTSDPVLYRYQNYPELFNVDFDFCT